MIPGDGTIAAVATPAGRGGLGIVRVSGPDAAVVAAAIFRPSRPRDPLPHARALPGTALGADGAALDRGLLSFFRSPRSYTGEDTAEVSIHGSPYLLARLLDAALAAGARAAAPGEFTWRAFRNGRLDLTQAEAVDDLIASQTADQARQAYRQLEGALARRLREPREVLLDVVARLEASLEFPEEDGTQAAVLDLTARLQGPRTTLAGLAQSYERGRVVRRGAVAVLAGAPNVGKSSLFNRLVGDDRAIVTAVPGTTRDLVAETVEIGGVPVRLIDTAGHGEAGDPIEAEGVRRAEEARRAADLVVVVLDASRPPGAVDRALLRDAPPDGVVALNKCDLPVEQDRDSVVPLAGGRPVIALSARTGEGVEQLRRAIGLALPQAGEAGDAPLTRRRQHEEVRAAVAAIDRTRDAAGRGAGEEILLVELAAAVEALGRLTGEVDRDEIYDRIFATFCIGK